VSKAKVAGIAVSIIVLWYVFVLFAYPEHYPYFGRIVRVDRAFGNCLVTIQRDGVQTSAELRVFTNSCEDIEVGGFVHVVERGWSLRIPWWG
jgi:hypothetical protein